MDAITISEKFLIIGKIIIIKKSASKNHGDLKRKCGEVILK